MAEGYNPIQSVGGVTVPVPSKFQWQLSDVSDADAGRTEDAKMHKMRIAQKIHIDLEWDYVSTDEASIILNAFQPEYINITYLDPKEAGFVTKRFYVGDRSAPLYNTGMDLWENVSFNIIEQ